MSRVAADALDTSSRPMGLRGWTLFCLTAVICAGCGWVAAGLAGFPLYYAHQGVLSQQPLGTMAGTLVAAALSILVATRLGGSMTLQPDARMGAALGMFALAGFSFRGGSMASVLAAGNGSETFLLLAGELAVIGVLAVGANLFSQKTCRTDAAGTHLGGVAYGVVQFVAFALVMWIGGTSYLKGQAIGTVFTAGLVASWLAHLTTGKTWFHGWAVPILCGIAGYAVNAAVGDTSPSLLGPAAAFTVASPLDYAAFGPIGILLGEMLHKHEAGESGEGHEAEPNRRVRRRA